MQTCLLVGEEHLPIPDTIKELHSFGEGNLVISEDGSLEARIFMGRILVLEGNQDDFYDWLLKVGGMWSTLNHEEDNWDFVEANKVKESEDGEEN
jgi:hypothetical protein